MTELRTEDALARKLLGLPLEEAKAILKEEGIAAEIINYVSLRGVQNANDVRVVRARIEQGSAQVVVSEFLTEI